MAAEQGATNKERLPAPRANRYRDAWCGHVSPARVGDEVRVAGWVHRRRDQDEVSLSHLREELMRRAA